MRRFATMALLFALGSYMLHAQEKQEPACTVINQYGLPVPGVQVGIKNKDFSVQTDSTGIIRFDFVPGDVLTFSHPNYLYREFRYKKMENFSVRLSEKDTKMNRTLDVAYGTVDRGSYLGSASTIYARQLATAPEHNIISSFAGQLGGLAVNQYQGFASNITTSANAANNFLGSMAVWLASEYSDNTQFSLSARGYAPIVLVDGVQRELYSLDPEAIESVSLQKDALSSMKMGMRSSRGVLVITTKKPSPGFQLSFTGKYGVRQPIKMPEPVSAYQWAYMVNEALSNDGKTTSFTQADFAKFRDGTDPYTHPDVDWYDQVLKSNATTQSYNLNASGGNRVAQFFISLGYMNEEGLFKELSSNPYNTNLGYSRYLISSKVDVNITDNLKAGVTVMGRIEDGNQPGAGSATILNDIYRTPNGAYPVFNPDELHLYGGNASFTNNLMSMVTNSGYTSTNSRDGLGGVTLDYNMDWLLKGLSAKATANVSTQNRTAIKRSKQSPVYQYIPSKTPGGQPTYDFFGSRQEQSNSFIPVYTFQHMYGQAALDYHTEIGRHAIGGSLMADMQQVLVNYNLPKRIINIIPGITYNYDRKYFAEATLSRSYFNQYNPVRQWGTFYAVGLGWDISREAFLADATWLNNLKLRGTYGLTGNGIDNAGYFLWRQAYSDYYLNYGMGYEVNQTFNSAYEKDELLANPDLSWEKAHKANIGLDASLLNNRLQISADYYFDKYFDLLQTRGKSIELIGLSYSPENIGKQERTGVELELTYNDRVGNFNYFVTANWSRHQSKLVFMDEQHVSEDYNMQTGKPVGAWFGLEADGFYASSEEITGSAMLQGFTIRPGDTRYKDLNNDGVIDLYDQKVIGNDKPLNIFGLSAGFAYRGLEFSVLFQGAYNRDIYLGDAGTEFLVGLQSTGQTYGQIYKHMLNRWTPETAATATFPRLAAGGNSYNANPNYWRTSLWTRSGNYIRMKNISLAYTLPEAVSRNLLGGVRVKFFVSGHNLLTWSACDLVDPEVVDFRNYPMMKGFDCGINIRF